MRAASAVRTTLLLPILAGLGSAQQGAASEPAAERARPVRYRITAGDFDGNGRSEAVTWDSASKMLSVIGFTGGKRRLLDTHALAEFPTALLTVDLDHDRRDELVIGEGLLGYNRAGTPPVDIRVRIYRPLREGGWTPTEVFRKASERPSVTALTAADLDRDGAPELVFGCFASKYMVELYRARAQAGAWSTEPIATVRMGMHVELAKLDGATRVLVGRPYGDALGELGGAFLLETGAREALPAFRGVSAVAAGDVNGDGAQEILVGDGWHQNYGRIARARLTVIERREHAWHAELIEDLPEHTRFVALSAIDLDGDSRAELLAHGERPRTLGGDLRLYRRTAGGWQGQTIATRTQGFAVGHFTRQDHVEALAAEPDAVPRVLRLEDGAWDTELAGAVETFDRSAKDLVGQPAPALEVEAWLGGALEKQGHGKVVLLDFWATWCKPCIAAFPTLRDWQQRYGPRGLVIVGVTHHDGQTRAAIEQFYEKQQLPWRIAIDPKKRPQVAFGVGAIPHLVLIDRAGIVRLTHVGAGKAEEVEQAIEPLLGPTAPAQDVDLRSRVLTAMRRASDFFASIATHGGWAGIYSADRKQRYGEATYQKAKPTQIWVQPPGTPSVGMALLRAAELTGKKRFLELAKGAGHALAWGQRQNGGWPYLPDLAHVREPLDEPRRRAGWGTFDDNTTQAALSFLVRLDAEVDAKWLTEAVELGFAFLAESQYENGAWPQRFPLRGGYADHYTFNDNAINDCIRVLLLGHQQYARTEYLELARRGGTFLIESQLARPQGGWAQQYDQQMKPAWARAFEPPGVCSAVTARNLRTLLELHEATGDARFLAPFPAAIEWLERSELSPGVWARFYELATNKPIYGDRDGRVHYTLEEISEERRSGYSWRGGYGVRAAITAYNARRNPVAVAPRPPAPRHVADQTLMRVLASLDEQGRWLDNGKITSELFVRNMQVLCDWLASR